MLVRLQDLDIISNLEAQCFKSQPYNQNAILGLLKQAECYGFTSLNSKLVKGYLIVQKSGDDYEIIRIGVIPEYQNQKLATTHLQLWLNTLTTQKCFLEVETNNLSAIKLYQNCGFKIIHTRTHYYRNGCDAYLMQLNALS